MSQIWIKILLIMLSLISYVFSDDVDMTIKNVTVKVMGHSGKIAITSIKSNSTNTTKETITINFSSLSEKDINGNEVGKTSSVKHTFNNFAQMDFVLTPVLPIKFQTIDAFYVNLTANSIVTPESVFIGNIFIFNGTGIINIGGTETAEVSEGTVKFSLDLENWPFCQNMTVCEGPHCCQKGQTTEIGSFLDFDLEISGSNPLGNVTQYDYKFGDQTKLILSSMIMVDDGWKKMHDGYPKLNTQGNKNTFTFRFPTFNNTARYDPVIQWSSTEGGFKWWIILLIVVLIVVFISCGIFIYKKCQKKAAEKEGGYTLQSDKVQT